MFARLDSAQRSVALAALSGTSFDVLVVGGGVVGAGAALDAASRGLSVALVEAHDWAAGTSSRSSKLVHGGLRYLEQLEFKLVREALRERGLLLRRLAPHLVRPVPFMFPLKSLWERLYVGAGVVLYDSIGGAGAVPMHRHLSRRRALAVGPSLKSSFAGAVRYHDAQMDDARLVLTLVRTAVQHGATVLSRARVVSLLRDGSTVVGARVSVDGAEIDVRARRVIGATGVWTDSLTALSPKPAPFRVRMSKGVHILVRRDRIALDGGLITRTEKSVLFVIPWGEYWIIGTTDTPYSGDPASVSATSEDVEYLLEHVNQWLCTPLFASDVVGTYAGLRPLLDGAGDTTKLSREHAVAEVEPGFFVTAGGKYTTYRVMAADVVDEAVRGLGAAVASSLTARLPLCGAVGYQEMWSSRASIAAASGLPVSVVEHLLGRYGSATSELLAMIEQDPELAAPLSGSYLAVEALYAVTHEGALDLDDVLSRRLRLAIEVPDRGAGVAGRVADLISGPLGWSDADRDAAVAAYQEPAWS